MLRLSSLTFLEILYYICCSYIHECLRLFLYVWNELFFTLSISKVNYAFHLSIYTSINRAIRFKGYQQQDSQELLRYLLDGMRAEEIQVSVIPHLPIPFLVPQTKTFSPSEGRKSILSQRSQPLVERFVLPISTCSILQQKCSM